MYNSVLLLFWGIVYLFMLYLFGRDARILGDILLRMMLLVVCVLSSVVFKIIYSQNANASSVLLLEVVPKVSTFVPIW